MTVNVICLTHSRTVKVIAWPTWSLPGSHVALKPLPECDCVHMWLWITGLAHASLWFTPCAVKKKSDTFFWCIVGLKIETCSVSMLFFWWGYGYMGLSLFQTSNVFMFFSKNVALPTTAAYANKNHLGCDEVGNNRFAWKPFGFFFRVVPANRFQSGKAHTHRFPSIPEVNKTCK